MRKILLTIGLLFFATLAFSQGWPRFFWVQIEQSDSTGSFAISNSQNNGEWNEVVRLLSGPYIIVGSDTLSTRDYVRTLAVMDSTRLTQDSILVYYQNGSEVGRDTISGVGGGGGSDGNGIFDATNAGGTIPANMQGIVTDELTITRNYDAGSSVPMMILDDDQAGTGTGGVGLRVQADANSSDTAPPAYNPFEYLKGGSFRYRVMHTDDNEMKLHFNNVSATIETNFDKDITIKADDDLILTSTDSDSIQLYTGNYEFLMGPSQVSLTNTVSSSGIYFNNNNVIFGLYDTGTNEMEFDVSAGNSSSFINLIADGSQIGVDNAEGAFLTSTSAQLEIYETEANLFIKTGSHDFKIHDQSSNGTAGLEYFTDYRSGYTDRTLPDWGNVKALISDSIAVGGGGDDWGAQVVQIDETLTGDGTTGNELGAAAPLSDIIEGLALDKPSLDVVNTGGTLYLEVEKVGGGDVRFWLGGVIATLDCTTGAGTGGKARVALTAGADARNPALNYIYATASGATASLNAGANVPTGAFAWVGKVLVPDVTTWTNEGEYAFQRFTESINDSRGQISHHREKTRLGIDGYSSGAAPSFSVESAPDPDSLVFTTTSGKVYQMHLQNWPAFNNEKFYYGNGLNVYERLDNLNEALYTSDSTAISSGRYYSIVLWGAINIDSATCKVFANMPNGTYNTAAGAQADGDNTADYTVPIEMKSVAFMLARVVLRYQGSTFTEVITYDLRGQSPGTRIGGTTTSPPSVSNDFQDSNFNIYDDGDATKRIFFEASGITSGQDRTLTAPDKSGTIALIDDIPATNVFAREDVPFMHNEYLGARDYNGSLMRTANPDSTHTTSIVFSGNSNIQSQTAYIPGIRDSLQRNFGAGGLGFISLGGASSSGYTGYFQKVASSGDWSHSSDALADFTHSVDGHSFLSTAVGDSITLEANLDKWNTKSSRLEVWYWGQTNGGTFTITTYKIKNNYRYDYETTTVNTSLTTGFQAEVIDRELDHYGITIKTTVAGSAGVEYIGVNHLNTTESGVVVHNISHSGAGASKYIDIDSTAYDAQIKQLNPKMFAVYSGTNDYIDGGSFDYDALVQYTNRVKLAQGQRVSIMTIVPKPSYASQFGPDATLDSVVTNSLEATAYTDSIMFELARDSQYVFVSERKLHGDYLTSEEIGFHSGDYVHYNGELTGYLHGVVYNKVLNQITPVKNYVHDPKIWSFLPICNLKEDTNKVVLKFPFFVEESNEMSFSYSVDITQHTFVVATDSDVNTYEIAVTGQVHEDSTNITGYTKIGYMHSNDDALATLQTILNFSDPYLDTIAGTKYIAIDIWMPDGGSYTSSVRLDVKNVTTNATEDLSNYINLSCTCESDATLSATRDNYETLSTYIPEYANYDAGQDDADLPERGLYTIDDSPLVFWKNSAHINPFPEFGREFSRTGDVINWGQTSSGDATTNPWLGNRYHGMAGNRLQYLNSSGQRIMAIYGAQLGVAFGGLGAPDSGIGVHSGTYIKANSGYYNTTSNISWLAGTGSPESSKTAPIGSIFSRTDGGSGTSLYVKESGTGNTGWTALTTGAAGASIDSVHINGDTLIVTEGGTDYKRALKLHRVLDVTPSTSTTISIDLDNYRGTICQIDMTTASTASNITLTLSNPETAGVYTFHFQNTGSTNSLDLPTTMKDQAGAALDGGTTYDIDAADEFFTCYYDGTNYYCK